MRVARIFHAQKVPQREGETRARRRQGKSDSVAERFIDLLSFASSAPSSSRKKKRKAQGERNSWQMQSVAFVAYEIPSN